jgi:polysaccharide biosynthesis protein PslH
MHVAIVDEELPYPLTSGKRIRIYNLAVHLAQRHRITFICHRNADRDEARQAERELHARGIGTVLVDRPQRRAAPLVQKARFATRIGLNLLSPLPYSAQWSECPRLRQAVRAYANEHAVDLCQCEWAPYATALMGMTGAPWVMMAHDIQSLIWERYYHNESNPLKRWYIKQQWHKYRRFERLVFRSADLRIMVTEEDVARASRQFGAKEAVVVDNGVDVAHYAAAATPVVARRPGEILFLGNLEWRPNLDAVRLLLDDVFPAVLAEVPSARLCVVGRHPPKWLVRRAQTSSNVEVHADVPDVRPYLYRCGAMAVPLRIGGGSRLKILEALATGLAVVSTQVGAEGLRLIPGVHYANADAMPDMASVLVRWMREPLATLDLVRAGRRLVEEEYDWRILALKMEAAWQDLLRKKRGAKSPPPVSGQAAALAAGSK